MESLNILHILSSIVLSESLESRSLYNAALNRPTNQSSTFNYNGHKGSSWHAVDGVLDPVWAHGSCASTKYLNDENWWQVDLVWKYYVTQVTVLNRFEHPERLSNFKIEVAEDIEESTGILTEPQLCYHYTLKNIAAGEIKSFQCPDNTDGRYVRITKVKPHITNAVLTICEVIVEVRADLCTNLDLAVNKTAFQTSTLWNLDAWRSVDGNLAPNIQNHQSCSHTFGSGHQWWQVDLGRLYHIKQVSIQNRDKLGFRLNNFTVEVSATEDFDIDDQFSDVTLCYHYTGSVPASVLVNLPCPKNLVGRYIRISKFVLLLNDALTLCEVVVEGGDPSCIGLTSDGYSTTTKLESTTAGQTITANTSETSATSLPLQCPCRCSKPQALEKYLKKTKESLVQELKEKLRVNKKETNSYIRKLISVDDGKVSSQNIGYVGIVLLVVLGLIIVIPDVGSLVTYIKNRYTNRTITGRGRFGYI